MERANRQQVIEAFISAYNGDLDKGIEHGEYYLSKRTDMPKLNYYEQDIRKYVDSIKFNFKGIKKEKEIEVDVANEEPTGWQKVHYYSNNLAQHNATDLQWNAFFKLQHNFKTIEQFVGSEIGKEYLNNN